MLCMNQRLSALAPYNLPSPLHKRSRMPSVNMDRDDDDV